MMALVAGLSQTRLAKVRGRLEAFADEMFDGATQRSEQRKWGGAYLRGLMLDGKRKSIEPMAARLEDGDEQCLQQFVNQSPWSWEVVRRNLARRMSAQIEPEAWIVDDTGFAKKGRWSVGVARQYSGTLGRGPPPFRWTPAGYAALASSRSPSIRLCSSNVTGERYPRLECRRVRL